jgi:hypothetical protein
MKGSVVVRSVIVLAVGAVLCGARLEAQPVLDQNQPSGPNYIAAFSQTDLAQSFQPGLGVCAGAGILLQAAVGSTDTVTIQLWTALPNVGGATMLAQGSAQGTAGQWVDVYWTPVPVTVGQTYYLVFTGNTTLGIAGDVNNPYPNGNVYANAGYGSFPTFDYAFRTWGGTAAVPLLGSSGLVILVMMVLVAGVVALRRLA